MNATDSSNLIDSPMGSRLGPNRALLYVEEVGSAEKFRPYGTASDDWVARTSRQIAGEPDTTTIAESAGDQQSVPEQTAEQAVKATPKPPGSSGSSGDDTLDALDTLDGWVVE